MNCDYHRNSYFICAFLTLQYFMQFPILCTPNRERYVGNIDLFTPGYNQSLRTDHCWALTSVYPSILKRCVYFFLCAVKLKKKLESLVIMHLALSLSKPLWNPGANERTSRTELEATQVIGHCCWHFAKQRYAIVLSSPNIEGEKGAVMVTLSGEILMSWVDNSIVGSDSESPPASADTHPWNEDAEQGFSTWLYWHWAT